MSLRWRPGATGGRVEVELKSECAARVGRSPAKSDAVAMAVVQTADEDTMRTFSDLAASGRRFADGGLGSGGEGWSARTLSRSAMVQLADEDAIQFVYALNASGKAFSCACFKTAPSPSSASVG